MKTTSVIPLVIVSMLLAGCTLLGKLGKNKPSATATQAAPVATAAVKADAATAQADAAGVKADADRVAIDAKVKANVDHARTANQDNADGPPKTIVDGDLQVAQSYLANVQADPAELAARERDAALVESGKAIEARANYDKANKDALTLAGELAKAQEAERLAIIARDTAREAENKARTDFIAQTKQNKIDADKRLQAAVDEERNGFFRWIGRALVLAGIGLIVVGAFSCYSSVQGGDVMKGITRAAVWCFFGAFLFSCAWVMNQTWFLYFVIGGAVIGLAAIGVMVRINWKDATEKKQAKVRTTEADEAERTLLKMQDVLDKNLPKDHAIFALLSSRLSDPDKALLNELKAEKQRGVIAV